MRAARLSLVVLLALAACGGGAQPNAAASGAAPLLVTLAAPGASGTRELRAGRVAEARAELERSLAADPDRIAALNDLAVSYATQERLDAARHLLEEVLARGQPREQQTALVNMGELYAIDGYLAAAEAYLASARAIDPSRPEPSYALALLADARGDGAAASAALRDALDRDRDGAARRELAFVYPEERLHLESLLAELAGDATTAGARWRELARGRFPVLAQAAQRHLEEP